MNEQRAVRVGDSERQATMEALLAHREAGRLDPVEYEDRQVAASKARTWSEIAPLFTDLPAPHPAGMPTEPLTSSAIGGAFPVKDQAARRNLDPAHGMLAGLVPARYRDTVMALVPFLALALFFVTKLWLWFLMIPIMGILLYGPGDDRNRRCRR
jgi:hypothetical protein